MGNEYANQRAATGTAQANATAPASVGKSSLAEHGGYDEWEPPMEGGATGPLASPRFAADAELEAVAGGTKTLGSGAKGIAVTKVQRALIELGYSLSATGSVDGSTTAALQVFQGAKSISPASGAIDKATILALDAAFSKYAVEGKQLGAIPAPKTALPEGDHYNTKKHPDVPKDLLAGTHAPTGDEKAAVADAISTEVKADPKTGKLPTFTKVTANGDYGARIEARIKVVLDSQAKRAKDAETERKAGHVYDWGDIEKVAVESKHAADASFGKYATGKALTAKGIDAKIKDAWDFKEKLLQDPAEADKSAVWRVNKILSGDGEIAKIDTEHGAIQARAAEAAIVIPLRDAIVAARRDELLLIHKWWPGFADKGNIYIQRNETTDPKTGKVEKSTGREYMWKEFQTIIHEYIHTLEHPNHIAKRGTMAEQKGNFVLREGTTDYFTKVAYNNAPITEQVRTSVEGPFHEKGITHTIAPLTTYRESLNAERVAGIVGLPNLCGSFFLGKTDLIGL